MALSNKFLSPTCAPDLGDIAYRHVLFFLKKIFRPDTRICVTMTSFYVIAPSKWRHYNTYSGIGSIFFSKKKYVAISPRPGAHDGERELLLSASKGLCCKKRRTLCPREVRTAPRERAAAAGDRRPSVTSPRARRHDQAGARSASAAPQAGVP